MNAPAADSSPSNLLQRLFGLEKHELVPVAWSFFYFFCVLSSYYVLRPVREMHAVGSGSNTIPWLFTATFVVMLLATPVFGWITSRFPRRQFLPWVYLFFIINILIFWGVFSVYAKEGQDHIWLGRIFFVWLSVFNLFVVSVFWSFMADIYSREQGRRLFGVIASGGSIGGLIFAGVTSILSVKIGSENLFPFAAALLVMAVVCIGRLRNWVSKERERQSMSVSHKGKPLGGSPLAGMTHALSSKYFGGIAVSSVIASLLGTFLYIFTAQLVDQAIADPDQRTRFFSNINVATLAISLLGQMFLVRHVVGRFGIGVSLALMPVLSVAGFAILAVNPTLAGLALLTIARRGLGFGFTKPTTDMLYSVVSPEDKYKSKNFVDTAIYRGGDLVGAWAIRGLIWLGFGISAISWIMVPFTAVWSIIAFWLGRDYRRRAKLQTDKPNP
ncbi:MAG: NTP/NDP exchange transporter [Woeseiaceae bacterium]